MLAVVLVLLGVPPGRGPLVAGAILGDYRAIARELSYLITLVANDRLCCHGDTTFSIPTLRLMSTRQILDTGNPLWSGSERRQRSDPDASLQERLILSYSG